MARVCPHCGAPLRSVVDGFCPDCREPLSEPPHEGRRAGAAVSMTSGHPCPFAWYATEKRLRSPFRLSMLDDRGPLELSPRRVRFTGRKGVVDCQHVQALTPVRQAMPWLSLIVADLLIVAMIAGGVMSFFTWHNPATVPLLVGLNAFFLMVAGRTKWVLVEYRGPSGDERRAYFTDGSAFGWGQLFGGVSRLLEEMSAKVLVD
jgi:hypothetical protein